MLHTKHVVNPARIALPSDLAGFYPIALTLDKFLDLYNDAKAFSVSIFALIDRTNTMNIGAISINESLENLEAFDNSSTDNYSFVGSTSRQIYPIGKLKDDGSLPGLSSTPTVQTEYPIHASVGVIIDFGKTLFLEGLLYPYISIITGNGMGNTAGGDIVGSVTLTGYGEIPIYGGPSVDDTVFGFAEGSITLTERYSNLQLKTRSYSVGQTIQLNKTGVFTGLGKYKTAFLNNLKITTTISNNSLSFVMPVNAKSGPIRFESSPPFDAFYSDKITIN